MKFVEKPHLPEGKVTHIIIGEEYCRDIDFDKMGITAVKLPKYENLDAPIRSHADMQVVHLYSNRLYTCANYMCKVNLLDRKNMSLICKLNEGILEPEYPECAAYNILILGKKVFYNPQSADREIIKELSTDHTLITIKQGFTRCSVCVVDENAVITADHGIANAMRNNGMDVLEIQPGNISLPGYNYGFIGGSSFKVSKYELAFTGKLDKLPDKERILNFIHAHSVREVILTSKELYDIGSAIPILEE